MERLHAHPDSTPVHRRDLDACLDRLVVARPGGRRGGVDHGQPPGLPSAVVIDTWASRSVLGETYWSARKGTPIPERHRVAP